MDIRVDRDLKYFLGVGILVFFLVIREAVLLPLTHDEYATIMVSYQSIFDIISYRDPVPNNHILNTLLLKFNIVVFGDNIFSNRIHNVLSFIPFFIFSVLIAKRITKVFLLQLVLISFLVLQPFLLDFFAVTRGYGLSISFQIVSIYFAILYIQDSKSSDLFYSVLFGAIGVYSNFTLLNYFLPLNGLLFYYSFLKNYKLHFKKFKIEFLMAFIITFILGALSFLPFSKMISTNQFVFWSSNNFFKDTIVTLFDSLRIGVTYFKWNGVVYALVFLGLIFSLFLMVLVLSNKKIFKDDLFRFSFFLLFLVIIYNNLQFYVAKVPFLNSRTALFFVPLVALFVFSQINVLYTHSKKYGTAISIVLILFCTQHFARGYNGRVNYEWYFNQNTYEFLDELMFQINSNNLSKPVLLDCHWFYHPSLTYHINQKYRGIIELLPYHKETNKSSNAIFYYSEPGEADVLSENFIRIKEFSGSHSILWKHK